MTTLNDRQIFTTTGRGIALADIPADLVKQIEVFKTQSADQFAGGLVGAINVDLRRPFDFDGFQLAGTLRGFMNVHLTKGLPAPPRDWSECQEPWTPEDGSRLLQLSKRSGNLPSRGGKS